MVGAPYHALESLQGRSGAVLHGGRNFLRAPRAARAVKPRLAGAVLDKLEFIQDGRLEVPGSGARCPWRAPEVDALG